MIERKRERENGRTTGGNIFLAVLVLAVLFVGGFVALTKSASAALSTGSTAQIAASSQQAPRGPNVDTAASTATATATCSPNGGYRILIVNAEGQGGQPTQLRTQLQAQPGVAAVDLFNAGVGTPTLSQLQQYDIVLPSSGDVIQDPVALGNNLADYVDGGGLVVQLGFTFYGPNGPFGINGRWATGGYSPYTYSTDLDGQHPDTLGTHDPNHPLMQGVTSLNDNYHNIVTPAAGGTQVAAWSDAHSLIATKAINNHIVVGITAFIGSSAQWSGDFARVIVNAGRWLHPSQCASSTVVATATTTTLTNTPMSTNTATRVATRTSTAIINTTTRTGTSTRTATAGVTGTATPTATVPPCGLAWRVVDHPNPGEGNKLFVGVEVVSANDVWAVGEYFQTSGGAGSTLTEHWDGSTWSVVSSPNPPGQSTKILRGVSAVSTNDVWAVGQYFDVTNGNRMTLIEHWDGAQWSIVSSPNPGPGSVLLNVAAVSTNDVWAAGSYVQNNIGYTLIEHWDGSTWSVVSSPNPVSGDNSLSAVAAVSANDVWAVGNSNDAQGHSYTLILHWNGTQWSVVTSPNPGLSHELVGVAVVSATDVWAVGDSYIGDGVKSLILHWNGTQWSVVSNPNPQGQSSDILNSLAVVASNDVWAVGNYIKDNSVHTLIEYWNGTQWSIVPSPSPGGQVSTLNGVASVSANDVWAVGYLQSNYMGSSLIERYNDPCVTPTVAPTRTGTPPTVAPTRTATATITLVPTATCAPISNPPVSYRRDDGTAEDAVGYGSNNPPTTEYAAIWLSRYMITPNTYPIRVTQISISWPDTNQAQGSLVGKQARLLAYQDTDANGDPSNAILLGQQIITISTQGAFENYAVNFTVTSGELYIGFEDMWAEGGFSPRLFPAAFDTDVTTAHRSYVATMANASAPNYNNLGANDFKGYIEDISGGATQGAWMIRASGTATNPSGCQGATSTPVTTAITTATRAAATSTRTATRTATRTTTATATATMCTLQFEDVLPIGPTNTFYPYVRCLACKGIISGYQCGGAGEPCDPGHNPYFRPNNPVSRGQIAKIVAQSAGFTDVIPPTQQTFEDVVPGTPFHPYIERLATRGIVGGYECGIAPNEPCIPPANRKYYRPDGSASRGQLAKIVSEAAGFHNTIPPTQYTFTDVMPDNPFWVYIERLLSNRPGVMSGYPCGGVGEPCDPQNRHYFRWGNPVTRGQASKIDMGTFFPGCNPARH